jgi:hypothetical protein
VKEHFLKMESLEIGHRAVWNNVGVKRMASVSMNEVLNLEVAVDWVKSESEVKQHH